jgi:hypothetical protein
VVIVSLSCALLAVSLLRAYCVITLLRAILCDHLIVSLLFDLQLTNEYALIGASGVGSKKMMTGARTLDQLRAMMAESSPFDGAQSELAYPSASVSCRQDDPASVAKLICATVLKSKAGLIDLTKLATKSWCGTVRPLRSFILPALEELVEAGVGEIVRLQMALPSDKARRKDQTRGYFHKTLTKEALQKLEALDSMDESGDTIALTNPAL